MKQAVLTLLVNALEARPTGGTLTLTTRLVATDGEPPVKPSPEQPRDTDGGATGTGMAAVPPAGPPATGEAPRWATVSVSDTGGGIPPEILGEVFNPFFTTKEVGTGLGLALVRRVARSHGGRVDVHNRPGEGVTFCLWLPVAPSLAAD
jgi:signal transduction histidine kinase